MPNNMQNNAYDLAKLGEQKRLQSLIFVDFRFWDFVSPNGKKMPVFKYYYYRKIVLVQFNKIY